MDKNESFKNIAETVTNVIKIYSLNAEKEIDEKFKLQLANSIYILTHIYVLLNSIVQRHNQDEVTDEMFDSQIILWQACNTMIGAIQLTRQGYPLEPQFLMRVAIESCALVVSFHLDANSYVKYKKEELSGKDCISLAKKVIPEIGQIYGLLSSVTHPARKTTGNNYNNNSNSVIIGGGYTKELSHRAQFNFALLNHMLLTIWKGAEFVCYEFEESPVFWHKSDDGYILKPHDSLKQMIKDIGSEFKNAISDIDNK